MTALEIVREWIAAVDAMDVLAVMARSARDIELRERHATSRGQPRLREWVERARRTMEIERVFGSGDQVVVAGQTTWRDANGLIVAASNTAHRFTVDDDRVTTVARCEHLEAALRDAGLTEADEIRLR